MLKEGLGSEQAVWLRLPRMDPHSLPGSFRQPLDGPWRPLCPHDPDGTLRPRGPAALYDLVEGNKNTQGAQTQGHAACGWRCGTLDGVGGGGAGSARPLLLHGQNVLGREHGTQNREPEASCHRTTRSTLLARDTLTFTYKGGNPAQPAPMTKLTRREPVKEGSGASPCGCRLSPH